MQASVDEVDRDGTRHVQMERFAIVPREFSADAGEVTPTPKLKRRVVQENFADEIDALYA